MPTELNESLTVVIPSKNEGKTLLHCIDLLRHQVFCRIVVADSSDDPESKSLLFQKSLLNKHIKIVGGGFPAEARNSGSKLVETEFVLFLDADIMIHEDHLVRHCLRMIKTQDLDLVTCKFRTERNYDWVFRIFDFFQWISSMTAPFAIGGFMLFRTSKFRELGGFYNQDKLAEDYHLSLKISPKKFGIYSGFAWTSARRFRKKGLIYMFKIATLAWWNRNNDSWFQKSYGYWS